MAKKKEPLSAKRMNDLQKQSAKLSDVSAALDEPWPVDYTEACSLLNDKEAHLQFKSWCKAAGLDGGGCVNAAKALIAEWKILAKAAKIKGRAVNKELARVEKLL